MESEGKQNGEVLTILKEIFDEVDDDKSCAIDYPEMIKLMEQINIRNPMSYEEFKTIMISSKSFVKLDADYSGTIELEEFFMLFKDLKKIKIKFISSL